MRPVLAAIVAFALLGGCTTRHAARIGVSTGITVASVGMWFFPVDDPLDGELSTQGLVTAGVFGVGALIALVSGLHLSLLPPEPSAREGAASSGCSEQRARRIAAAEQIQDHDERIKVLLAIPLCPH